MYTSIYAMSYRDHLMQNREDDTRSLAQATDGEDIKRTGLQQSMGTARSIQKDIREDDEISLVQRMQGTEVYRQIEAGKTEQQLSEGLTGEKPYVKTVRMDKVEISEEGRTANARMQQQTEDIDTMQEVMPADMEYKIDDLSRYTDAELEQMYYRGEITLQEYEEETGEVLE